MEEHGKRVAAISDKVKGFHDQSVAFRIYHGATNSTRIQSKDTGSVIDTSGLRHVLSVDEEGHAAVVEPNVAMDNLIHQLLPYGLLPRVVPEFPGITVGGSFSGTAAESSSFREGYFDRTVNWVEIVLADGEVVRASPEENADLFYAAAGASGTLGVVTLLEVKLMRTSQYLRVSYKPTRSMTETLEKLAQSEEDLDICFLDAILFVPDSGVVIEGRMDHKSEDRTSCEQESPVVRFSRPTDPWFSLHAHSKLGHQKPSECCICTTLSRKERFDPSPALTELVPTSDYLLRYDRGTFWMGCYGWNTIPLPFNSFGRRVLDRLFRTRTMYSVMHHAGQSQRFVIQDLAIPTENAESFIKFVEKEIGIWPLWLCPIAGGSKALMHSSKTYKGAELDSKVSPKTMNIGLWGIPCNPATGRPEYYNRNNFSEFIALNGSIESKVRELGGLKWLYAHNYTIVDEFWQSYDLAGYQEVRQKWRADGKLPSIWDKIGKEKHEWVPTNMLRGLWNGWLGKDYLIKK